MTALPGVAGRLAALRAQRGATPTHVCDAVRDLVVVCSSSRGGSSLFGELLRRSPSLLTFSAEINPHVMIPTLGAPGGCSTVADPSPYAGTAEGLAILRAELGADLGRATTRLDRLSFSRHVAWRLTMQWPEEPIDFAAVEGWVHDTLDAQGDADKAVTDREAFFTALVPRVLAAHPSIDPGRYDLAAPMPAHPWAAAPFSLGPTAEPVVEMAPFVLPRAWDAAIPEDAARLPVVATTPRNAFRLPLLAAAFPNARLRVLHLTRNPAAAINGLRDGWRHHGFFSARSEAPLHIAGYSDEFPDWGGHWWNYDVPPGWREWTDQPLPAVCGFQWRAAHEHSIETAASMGLDVHRVAFEDVVASSDRRQQALTAVCDWLGLDPAPVTGTDRLPVVMPTQPPRRRRWEDNAGALSDVLRDAQILDTAAMLGYSRDPADWE